jgi:hypothetical protein
LLTILSIVALSPGWFLADFLRVDVSRPLIRLTGMQIVVLIGWLAAGIVTLVRGRVSSGNS